MWKCDRCLNVKPADISHCGQHDAPESPRRRGIPGGSRYRAGCDASLPLTASGHCPAASADSRSRPTRTGSRLTAGYRSAGTLPEHPAGTDVPASIDKPRQGFCPAPRGRPPDTAPMTRAKSPSEWTPDPARQHHASSGGYAALASGCRTRKPGASR